MATAATTNTEAFVIIQNQIIGKATLGGVAERLSQDQIFEIATAHNPDGRGTSPAWLTVGACNHWQEYFALSLSDPSLFGIVQIMIVNTVVQTTLNAEDVGSHWFLAVWVVDDPSHT